MNFLMLFNTAVCFSFSLEYPMRGIKYLTGDLSL